MSTFSSNDIWMDLGKAFQSARRLDRMNAKKNFETAIAEGRIRLSAKRHTKLNFYNCFQFSTIDSGYRNLVDQIRVEEKLAHTLAYNEDARNLHPNVYCHTSFYHHYIFTKRDESEAFEQSQMIPINKPWIVELSPSEEKLRIVQMTEGERDRGYSLYLVGHSLDIYELFRPRCMRCDIESVFPYLTDDISRGSAGAPVKVTPEDTHRLLKAIYENAKKPLKKAEAAKLYQDALAAEGLYEYEIRTAANHVTEFVQDANPPNVYKKRKNQKGS